MSTDRRLALVEFALWVLGASAIVVAVTLPVALVIGGDLVAAKAALFLVGFALFGAGSVAIQPSGPDLEGSVYSPDGSAGASDEDRSGNATTSRWSLFGRSPTHRESDAGPATENRDHRELGYEARLQEVGPLAERHLPYEKRIGRGYKIFATGIVVLAVSFLMEVAGVQI